MLAPFRMSIKSTLFWAGIGGGLIALLVREGRRRGAEPVIEALPRDPEIEAALDLQSLDVDALDLATPSLDATERSTHDVGALYGVSTPRAGNTTHLDEDQAMDAGETWLEALAVDAVEDGADPEQPLAITDDADLDHSSLRALERDDIPVADRGAGGPAGI